MGIFDDAMAVSIADVRNELLGFSPRVRVICGSAESVIPYSMCRIWPTVTFSKPWNKKELRATRFSEKKNHLRKIVSFSEVLLFPWVAISIYFVHFFGLLITISNFNPLFPNNDFEKKTEMQKCQSKPGALPFPLLPEGTPRLPRKQQFLSQSSLPSKRCMRRPFRESRISWAEIIITTKSSLRWRRGLRE